MNIDPMAEKAYDWTPFRYGFDNPVKYSDFSGLFELDPAMVKKYPRLAEYLKNSIGSVTGNERIMNSLMKYSQLDRATIEKDLQWGNGPRINPTKLEDDFGNYSTSVEAGIVPGFFAKYRSNVLNIDEDLIKELENATGEERDALLFLVGVTVLHEYVHYGDAADGKDYKGKLGRGEEGNAFEISSYGKVINRSNYREVYKKWKSNSEQKNEENKSKKKDNGILDLFNSSSGGTYKWNGSNWIKQ